MLGLAACAIALASWWDVRRKVSAQASSGPPSVAMTEWLRGSDEERFKQIEKHLRGLDQTMAEIGYRYGELLVAGKERNWEHAKYQTEKIDLSLRLALERRPKRAQSSQAFLNEDLPAVVRAVQSQDAEQLDRSLDRLHNSCVECHSSEKVLYFRSAVERIRDNAIRQSR
jgi:uncharacterized ferritin-like protein (DUF455 family)